MKTRCLTGVSRVSHGRLTGVSRVSHGCLLIMIARTVAVSALAACSLSVWPRAAVKLKPPSHLEIPGASWKKFPGRNAWSS